MWRVWVEVVSDGGGCEEGEVGGFGGGWIWGECCSVVFCCFCCGCCFCCFFFIGVGEEGGGGIGWL